MEGDRSRTMQPDGTRDAWKTIAECPDSNTTHSQHIEQCGNSPTTFSLCSTSVVRMGKKVKASHTRYRALSLELITMYRQSARRWL